VSLFASVALSVGLLACVDMEDTDEGVDPYDTEAAAVYSKPIKLTCTYVRTEYRCNVGQLFVLSADSTGLECEPWMCVDDSPRY
jgi:hypothetical protein